MKWKDSREIAEELYDSRPDIHPLGIRFTDLHRWVTELEEFDDDPEGSNEGLLEAIQMIWYEEWKEDNPDAPDPYQYGRS